MNYLQSYLRSKLDLSNIGFQRGERESSYFCTPVLSKVIGWAGVDGIHFCTTKGFEEMIFAVSPMNTPGSYVHPVARNFEDFLRLILACHDTAAIEQCWFMDREVFDQFILDNPPTDEMQACLDAIRKKYGIAPMEDPFGYLHKIQKDFNYSLLKYSAEYYELVPETVKPPEWKVSFHGGFSGIDEDERAGKEIAIGENFEWAGHQWVIPAAYSCTEGLVIDFCMRIDPNNIHAFMEKWNLNAENESHKRYTYEERLLLDYENPLTFCFNSMIHLNGKLFRPKRGCGVTYNPCLPLDILQGSNAQRAVEHYRLDMSYGWLIRRVSYLWTTKRKPTIKSLSVTMEQQKVSTPGPHFHVTSPGDTVTFTYHDKAYTLTVHEYEQQTLKVPHEWDVHREYPEHLRAMSYTIAPELPDGTITVSDCAENDEPRLIPQATGSNVCGAVSVGIIGCADGPTAIICGTKQQTKLHAACSALHFESVGDVEWRITFHEKPNSDLTISLI